MAWLAVNKDGTEIICEGKPGRDYPSKDEWNSYYESDDGYIFTQIKLPAGSIEMLTGIKLTWNYEPIEI